MAQWWQFSFLWRSWRRRCGLISNDFDHLLLLSRWRWRGRGDWVGRCAMSGSPWMFCSALLPSSTSAPSASTGASTSITAAALSIDRAFCEWSKQQNHFRIHRTDRRWGIIYRASMTMSGNEAGDRNVFKRWRKVDRDGADITLSGRLFQMVGPATGKARPPTI